MLVIVDYRLGNLGSIRNMLRRIGVEATVAADPETIAAADRLILPGVGAFAQGMANIAEMGLREVLDRRALVDRVPVLGICLGMQLMTRGSEEGDVAGLGWIAADTVRFRFPPEPSPPEPSPSGQLPSGPSPLRIPHIGWNTVEILRPEPLFRGLDQDPDTAFYFVHSYHARCDDAADVLARTRYGYDFDAAIGHGNVLGTQFHPEKSHRFGMQLLRNFVESAPC